MTNENKNKPEQQVRNGKEIVKAFRSNLGVYKTIQNLKGKTDILIDKSRENIREVTRLYGTIFKNFSSVKSFITDIDYYNDGNYYWIEDLKFRKLFLNKDGFSVSEPFKEEKDIGNAARSSYPQATTSNGVFIKFLKRIIKNKQVISDVIKNDYKKTIFQRFIEAMEESKLDDNFSYSDDWANFRNDEIKSEIEYYDNGEIVIDKVNYFSYAGQSSLIDISSKGHYNNSFSLDDLQKIEQVYEELENFFKEYEIKLIKQEKSLANFIILLKSKFAKELIMNSLKDNKDGN